jgi:ribonuclease M5
MEEKMKIKEIIVVEGRDDTTAVQQAVEADTIETNGSAINKATIAKIQLAQQTRGVIVFTDPDYPGERIRKIISEHVKGCKHAFLPKQQAKPKKGRGLGVEHASRKDIRDALQNVYEEFIDIEEEITHQDLMIAGLIGGSTAKKRREILGQFLKIGYANGKQLHKRLLMFQITKEQFKEAMVRVLEEEK